MLRLELLLPVELERCLDAKEALRSSEPGAPPGSSEYSASGDVVCCPSPLLAMDAESLKAEDEGVGGLEFRRSRLNFGISIREYEDQKTGPLSDVRGVEEERGPSIFSTISSSAL